MFTTKPIARRYDAGEPEPEDRTARLVALLATALNRCLARQEVQDGGAVDFCADQSVSTTHPTMDGSESASR